MIARRLALPALSAFMAVAPLGEPRGVASPGDDWTVTTSQMIQEGRCREALTFLDTHHELATRPVWYSLYLSSSETCYAQTRDERTLARAVEVSKEGTARYPRSSPLIVDRAILFIVMRRLDDAAASYKEAKKVAEENVAADHTGVGATEDRELLGRIDRQIENLEKLRKRETNSTEGRKH